MEISTGFRVVFAGYPTIVEANGDQEDVVQRDSRGAIEGISDLRLKAATLVYGVARIASNEEIAAFNGVLNSAGPVLAGQEFAPVEPGRISTRLHSQTTGQPFQSSTAYATKIRGLFPLLK